MRIIQLTDCHICGDIASNFDGINTKATFDCVLDSVLKVRKADLIIGTGDISMDGSSQAYSWLQRRLNKANLPVILIPGNHDKPDEFSAQTGSKCFARYNSVVREPWCFHFLNTAKSGHHAGKILKADLMELSLKLQAQSKSFHAIFMHHPPVSVGSIWLDEIGLKNAADFWDHLRPVLNVKLIVCGHIHQELDIINNGVRVLASPSTCLQFKPLTDEYTSDSLEPGFRVIDFLSGGGIETEVIRVKSPLAPQSITISRDVLNKRA